MSSLLAIRTHRNPLNSWNESLLVSLPTSRISRESAVNRLRVHPFLIIALLVGLCLLKNTRCQCEFIESEQWLLPAPRFIQDKDEEVIIKKGAVWNDRWGAEECCILCFPPLPLRSFFGFTQLKSVAVCMCCCHPDKDTQVRIDRKRYPSCCLPHQPRLGHYSARTRPKSRTLYLLDFPIIYTCVNEVIICI